MLLLLGEDGHVADPLVRKDAGPVLGDPVQRVDRRDQLHRVGLVEWLALLAREELCDLVERVDDHLRGAPHVAGSVG